MTNGENIPIIIPFPQAAAFPRRGQRSTRWQLRIPIDTSTAPDVATATAISAHLRNPRSPIPTRPTAPREGASAARCNPQQPESVSVGTAVLWLRWLATIGFSEVCWRPLAANGEVEDGVARGSDPAEEDAAAVPNDDTSRPILELPTASRKEASAAQYSLQRPWNER